MSWGPSASSSRGGPSSSSAPTCPVCYSTKIVNNPSDGNTVCMMCGTVVAENVLSAEIGFGESSSGAAIVQGSYVSDSAMGAKLSRPGARHGNVESREVTIGNGKRACMALALTLNLSPTLAEAAGRWFTLAVQHEFTKGRKSQYVIAACLYIACRQAKNDVMLIDFSDKLQVNVFELGATYLKLVRKLNIQRIPLIDPSIYIQRFANLLEFGDDTQRVATDATRLVARFERDWMQTGRRPSGICGACLILAARMNNFRRSITEVVQVVKIADVTLRKRLAEFQATKSGQLTVQEFRTVWLDENSERPPAMIRNLKKEAERERKLREGSRASEDDEQEDVEEEGEEEEEDEEPDKENGTGKKRKRDDKLHGNSKRRIDISQIADGDPASSDRRDPNGKMTNTTSTAGSPTRAEIETLNDEYQHLLHDMDTPGAVTGEGLASQTNTNGAVTSVINGQDVEEALFADLENGDEISRALEAEEANSLSLGVKGDTDGLFDLPDRELGEKTDDLDDPVVDGAVEEEILEYMGHDKPSLLAGEIDRADERRLEELRRRHEAMEDDLQGLDEDELDGYLLDEHAIKVKTMIWNKFNHEYMVKLHAKQAKQAGELESNANKPKRSRNRQIGPAATHEEAVVNLAKHKKFSRKINYESLAKMMNDDDDDEGDNKLRRMSSATPMPGPRPPMIGGSPSIKISESQLAAESEATAGRQGSKITAEHDDGEDKGDDDALLDPTLRGLSSARPDAESDKEEDDEEGDAMEVIEEPADGQPPSRYVPEEEEEDDEMDEWSKMRRGFHQEDEGGFEEV